ncbi:MAG: phosphomannose isomerase type II C-terminal cupin domain [Geobacteraceae bacterium]
MEKMHIINDIRPWGSFRQFTDNQQTTVKIINVTAGQRLSLQYHNHRDEFWVVLSGNPRITIGADVLDAAPGDEFTVPVNTLHRMEAPKNDACILEIAFGDFDENDIVRLEDAYGRIT